MTIMTQAELDELKRQADEIAAKYADYEDPDWEP